MSAGDKVFGPILLIFCSTVSICAFIGRNRQEPKQQEYDANTYDETQQVVTTKADIVSEDTLITGEDFVKLIRPHIEKYGHKRVRHNLDGTVALTPENTGGVVNHTAVKHERTIYDDLQDAQSELDNANDRIEELELKVEELEAKANDN